MAQIVYHRRVHGAYPLLLLDDVLSELDADKKSALISFLTTIDSQIFITTTDLTVPDGLSQKDYSVFQVTEGEFNDNRVNEQLRRGLDTSP
jgi:DNA replication and repair protein RecF